MIHWSLDDWRTATDTNTRDTGFGVHIADLPVPFGSDGRIRFTFLWLDDSCWEGADYEVGIAPG
jgi:glucoamylase